MKTITFEIDYSADDYIRAFTFAKYRKKHSKFIFVFAKVFFILYAIFTFSFGTYILIKNDSFQGTMIILGGFLGMLIIFGIKPFENFWNRMLVQRQIKSSPLLQAKSKVTVNREEIQTETNLSENKVKWDAFVKILESEDDFLFFTAKRSYFFIPKRNLREKEINSLREFLKSNFAEKFKD